MDPEKPVFKFHIGLGTVPRGPEFPIPRTLSLQDNLHLPTGTGRTLRSETEAQTQGQQSPLLNTHFTSSLPLYEVGTDIIPILQTGRLRFRKKVTCPASYSLSGCQNSNPESGAYAPKSCGRERRWGRCSEAKWPELRWKADAEA